MCVYAHGVVAGREMLRIGAWQVGHYGRSWYYDLESESILEAPPSYCRTTICFILKAVDGLDETHQH